MHQRLDRIGAKSSISWYLSTIMASAYADKKHFPELMQILTEGIFTPKWSEDIRRRAVRKLFNERDVGDNYVGTQLQEGFFAAAFSGTPLATGFRTKESLKDITLTDLQEFHKKWIVPEVTNLVVVGNIDSDRIGARLKESLDLLPPGDFPENPKSPVDLNVPLPNTIELEVKTAGAKDMAYLAVGYRFPSIPELIKSPDMEFAACMSLVHILRIGTTSLIQREFFDTGLAVGRPYEVLSWNLGPGFFLFALEIPLDRLSEAKTKLKAILAGLPGRDISAEEIAVAAKFSDAAFWIGLERSHQQATFFASLMRLGVGPDLLENIAGQFRSLTPEMAKKTAGKYFQNFVLITGKSQ